MQPFGTYLSLALLCSLTVSLSSLAAGSRTQGYLSPENQSREVDSRRLAQAPTPRQPSQPSPGMTVRGADPSDLDQQQQEETLTIKTAIKTIITVQAPIEVSCQPMAVVAARTYPTSTAPQRSGDETPAQEIMLKIVDGKTYISCTPMPSEVATGKSDTGG